MDCNISIVGIIITTISCMISGENQGSIKQCPEKDSPSAIFISIHYSSTIPALVHLGPSYFLNALTPAASFGSIGLVLDNNRPLILPGVGKIDSGPSRAFCEPFFVLFFLFFKRRDDNGIEFASEKCDTLFMLVFDFSSHPRDCLIKSRGLFLLTFRTRGSQFVLYRKEIVHMLA